jgi:hypothetical protein
MADDRWRRRDAVAIFCLRLYDHGMSKVRLSLIALSLLGAIVIGAPGRPALAAQRLQMQALIEPDGGGRLFVQDPGGEWKWESCTSQLTECTRVAGGRELTVRGEQPGTVFVVRGGGLKGVSPEWRGAARVITPPRAAGEVRAGGYVDPIPGRWTGGWKGEYSQLQMAACAGPDGGNCTALTGLHYLRPCPVGNSIVLPSWTAGRYLRVAERRVGGGPPVEPAYAVSGTSEEVWTANRTVAVAVVGEILPPPDPPEGECGPPLEPRAWISKDGVASVECQGGCAVELVADRDGRTRRVRRRVSASGPLLLPPPLELQFSKSDLRRLGVGRLHVVVLIDGRKIASRALPTAAD